METNNGYRFADLAPGESLCSPTVCDCCGREELKRTIKLINPVGRSVWFGTGCAARAMGVTPLIVKQARVSALAASEANEEAARVATLRKHDSEWQSFLNTVAGVGERFTQIQSLGGYVKARALFVASKAS